MAENRNIKNPRFAPDSVPQLRFPEESRVVCRDCIYRAKDIGTGEDAVKGAVLGICDAFSIKPPSILLDGAECPYYFGEDE